MDDTQNNTDTTGQDGLGQNTDTQQTSQAGQQPTEGEGKEGGSGFVGSSADPSSDYLTEEGKQDVAPEGQGASDTDAGTADMETGQSSATDSTLDDGADTAG